MFVKHPSYIRSVEERKKMVVKKLPFYCESLLSVMLCLDRPEYTGKRANVFVVVPRLMVIEGG